jgi:phosphonate metabolism protein (transferase hexapeptide repeat family)
MLQSVDHMPKWNPRAGQRPSLGEKPCIHPTATVRESRIGAWTEIGALTTILESTVGDYSYVAGCHSDIWCAEVGKFTSIAAAVRINPPNHPVWRVTQHHCTYRRHQYGFDTEDDADLFAWRRSQKVTIGHDVWIGHGAVILPGVEVGTGAVVGAGAVVSKPVAPYDIVAGVPARKLRARFASHIVDALLAIAWWDWDRETLCRRFRDLLDIEQFVVRYADVVN